MPSGLVFPLPTTFPFLSYLELHVGVSLLADSEVPLTVEGRNPFGRIPFIIQLKVEDPAGLSVPRRQLWHTIETSGHGEEKTGSAERRFQGFGLGAGI